MSGLGVTAEGVSCRYGRSTVVHDVALDVAPGERVALIGTNGSGKTTLLRALLGLHRPVAGTIRVGDLAAVSRPDWVRRRQVCAWIPQKPAAGRFPLLGSELLASTGATAHATAAARTLGVSGLVDHPLHTLSGGQLQRMYLARAIGAVRAGAQVLLADEPTAALDFDGQAEAAGILTALPATLLVVTHDRALAARCDRRLEMAAGRLREVA